MTRKLVGNLVATAAIAIAFSAAVENALAQALAVPAGYPAAYSEILDKAKTEGKVVVYSNMSAIQWAPFVKMAAAKYPWLKIEATDSGDDMWEKYYAESKAGAATADVMLTNSVDRWPQLSERGEIMNYQSAEMAALPAWSIPYPGLYTMSTDPTILVYNKFLISANDAPKSRKDVLDLAKKRSDLKGKITVFDARGNSLALGALWLWTRSREDAWPLLEAVGPFMRPEVSAGTVREKVVTGEYAIALMSSGANIATLERPENKPIAAWLFPTDGVPVSMRNVAITKAARNPNAAKVLLDLLLSREGQIAMAQGGQTPYREDIKRSDVPFITYNSVVEAVGEKNIMLIKPDPALIKERDAFTARWEKIFAK